MDKHLDYNALKNLDIDTVPLEKQIEAFYKGTCAATDLAREVMLPQLRALIKPSIKEEAVKGLYYRMYAWMCSLVSLNGVIHCQAIASATRSIFELLLDIKLLIENKPKDSMKKFEAFIDIEKYRAAKKSVNFKKSNPDLKYKISLAKEKLLKKYEEENKIDKLILANWGKDKNGKPKRVEHWTGWGIDKRAEEAGKNYEFFYHESFALLSWYVHSSLVGFKGMRMEGFNAIFGNSHRLAATMFLDATLLVARELKLIQAIPQLVDWVEKAKLTVGKAILEEQIKYLSDLENKNLSK